MDRVRVLVVDDSVVIRRLLSELLAEDPELEVMGTAPNASLALSKLRAGLPDVVTLDVEMPDVTGLELLEQIRELAPRLPVIMFSSLTQRAASTTLEALSRGASDYVTKPANAKSREDAREQVRAQLIPRIKTLARRGKPAPGQAPRPAAPRITASAQSGPIEVVAIGSSTGGPNALSEIFRQLAASFPVPIVITQHMPPMFTRLLAERLSSVSGVKVREACAGDVLKRGEALVAPGDFHMKIVRGKNGLEVALDQGPQENSCRPAVDVMFRSLAASCGPSTLGVVLTGMGQDGLKGGELLRQVGGRLLAQDEASSVVWGMPGFVARAGLCEAVLPLDDIASAITTRVAASVLQAGEQRREVAHAGA